MSRLLEIAHLSMAFRLSTGLFSKPRLVPAVTDVNLTLDEGRVLAVVGESGSGKSTLARLVLQLLQPDSGAIILDGREVSIYGSREFAALVQPVFQDPYSSLNPKRNLAQIIQTPLVIRGGVSARDRDARAREMLDMVGLPQRLFHSYPNQISGGQRQRVAIARALMTRPRLLVCDEPTSALDVSVQAQVLELFERLKREFGLTYLFISHDLAVVERIADTVAVMYRGRIVESGATDRIFADPQDEYTRMLLGSVLPPIAGRPLPRIVRPAETAG